MTGSKAAAAGACEMITKLWYLEIWANIWQIWIMLWNVAQLLLEEPAVMTGLEIQKCMGCILGYAASVLVSRINNCCSTVVNPHCSMTDKPTWCSERHCEEFQEGDGGSFALSSPQHAFHISFKQLLSVSMACGHHLGKVNQRQLVIITDLWGTALLSGVCLIVDMTRLLCRTASLDAHDIIDTSTGTL